MSSSLVTNKKVEGISIRAIKLLKGPLPYIDVFIQAMPDLWSPTNPEGWITLVVAENKLGNQLMLDRMNQVSDAQHWVMNYGSMKGAPPLQASLARLMNRTFVPEPILDPNNMCILSGCSAILDSLFYCLADDHQSILIPAPYYPAFDNDLQAKNNLFPVPFSLDETSNITEQLNKLAEDAKSHGKPVAALLITNPNNPLGTIYRESSVYEMIGWCLKNDVHYVSDEIYALSVYNPPLPQNGESISIDNNNHADKNKSGRLLFTSALALAQKYVESSQYPQEKVDTLVHLIYGLSKDWCASGLRVGILYTRNKPLQRALDSVALFSSISNYTQHALTEVFDDVEFTDSFLEKNAALLLNSYKTLENELKNANIPFLEANAGMFVWIDLRKWLVQASWDGEAELWKKLCDDAKIILTPGSSCHASEPGYFRLCFAWVAAEALADAVKRIQICLNTR